MTNRLTFFVVGKIVVNFLFKVVKISVLVKNNFFTIFVLVFNSFDVGKNLKCATPRLLKETVAKVIWVLEVEIKRVANRNLRIAINLIKR